MLTFIIGSILFLTGCTTTQLKSNQNKLPVEIESQLVTQQAIIGYFGRKDNPEHCSCLPYTDSTYYTQPVKDGYYRVLLGRNTQGHFLIQDFYENTKQPQSSPVWIKNPIHLFSFNVNNVEGLIIIYDEQGRIISKLINQDGETIAGEDYYRNGQVGSKYYTKANGYTHVQLWYQSGKKAADYLLSDQQELIKSELWQENGTYTDDLEKVISQVYSLLTPHH